MGAADRPAVLDPRSIPKYVTPLVIPPAMPRTAVLTGKGKADRLLRDRRPAVPAADPAAGHGPRADDGVELRLGRTTRAPSTTRRSPSRRSGDRPVRVKWINDLVDANGNYLPHLLPVDQTLHWANPPGGPSGTRHARHGRRRPTPGRCRSSPTCTAAHTHRGERRLPRGLVPAGRDATSRPATPRRARCYDQFKQQAEATLGSGVEARARAVFQYSNDQRADDALVPRPHAGHDPRQRVRRAGRLLPAARRARRRWSAGRCPARRRRSATRRDAVLRDPDRHPGPLVQRRRLAVLPGQPRVLRGARRRRSCRSRSSPTRPAAGRATSRRSGTRSSSATRWSSTARPGRTSTSSSGATASAS